MAEQSALNAQEPDGRSQDQEAAPAAKGPLIPPSVVRFSILGGVLVVLAVGAVFLVTDVIAPRLRSLGQPPAAAETQKKAKAEAPGEVVAVSDLIVNPAGTGGRRYLKVAAAIEVHDPKVAKDLELRKAQVRDLLIRDLSARTLDELTDPVAKEETRATLVDELNEIVGAGKVSGLYFTEYVVQ
jgi:flagellar protein FliL